MWQLRGFEGVRKVVLLFRGRRHKTQSARSRRGEYSVDVERRIMGRKMPCEAAPSLVVVVDVDAENVNRGG